MGRPSERDAGHGLATFLYMTQPVPRRHKLTPVAGSQD